MPKRRRELLSREQINVRNRKALIQDHTVAATKSILLLGKYSNITPFIVRRGPVGFRLDLELGEAESGSLEEVTVGSDVEDFYDEVIDMNIGSISNSVEFIDIKNSRSANNPMKTPKIIKSTCLSRSGSPNVSHSSLDNCSIVKNTLIIGNPKPSENPSKNQRNNHTNHSNPPNHSNPSNLPNHFINNTSIQGLPPRRPAQYINGINKKTITTHQNPLQTSSIRFNSAIYHTEYAKSKQFITTEYAKSQQFLTNNNYNLKNNTVRSKNFARLRHLVIFGAFWTKIILKVSQNDQILEPDQNCQTHCSYSALTNTQIPAIASQSMGQPKFRKLESGKVPDVGSVSGVSGIGFENKVLRNLNFQRSMTIPRADPYGSFNHQHIHSSDSGFSSGFLSTQNTAEKNSSSTDKSKTAFSKLPQYYH